MEYTGENSSWNATKEALRASNPVKFFKSCLARWKRRNNRNPNHPVTTKDGWTAIGARFPLESALAIMERTNTELMEKNNALTAKNLA
jgi:hypothetical protein